MLDSKISKKYDLEERTTKFWEEVIKFSRKISKNLTTLPLITQFVKSGTSVGANYCEADEAESAKDFKHKIRICKKEAREVKYWLRIIVPACPELKEEARNLWQEAKD